MLKMMRWRREQLISSRLQMIEYKFHLVYTSQYSCTFHHLLLHYLLHHHFLPLLLMLFDVTPHPALPVTYDVITIHQLCFATLRNVSYQIDHTLVRIVQSCYIVFMSRRIVRLAVVLVECYRRIKRERHMSHVHHVTSRGRDNRQTGHLGQLVTSALQMMTLLFLRMPMPMMTMMTMTYSHCMNG